MRWFSHRRSRTREDRYQQNRMLRKPPSTWTAVTPSPPAATQWSSLLLHTAYGLQCTPRLTIHCQLGWLSTFSFFVPAELDLWPLTLTFELGHPTAKFHHPTFNRSEVIMRTNKLANKLTNEQTDAAENIHLAPLCYAVGNNNSFWFIL